MPMDRSLYPPDWEEISRRAREEAGNRCEWCGVKNGTFGFRVGGTFTAAAGPHEFTEGVKKRCRDLPTRPRCFRIVLTTMHVDHNPSNNERSNLVAACQRCHLNHDRVQHQANAAVTRARKRGEALATSGQLSLI